MVASLKLATDLRKRDVPCEVYLNPGDKIGKQLGYADNLGIPYAVIQGPDEIASNQVTIKALKEPQPNQQTLPREEAIEMLARKT
jgi:histidyl-tRNA synthetase